jgi:hypothetical protein
MSNNSILKQFSFKNLKPKYTLTFATYNLIDEHFVFGIAVPLIDLF